MRTIIGSQLEIEDPSRELMEWVKKEMVLANPEYAKKSRMGLWLGNTPATIRLYSMKGTRLVLPFGTIRRLMPILSKGEFAPTFHEKEEIDYRKARVPLYDYQQKAVDGMIRNTYGILQSPAGSGKTQMGEAIAVALKCRTLWLTHTKDLLNQSKTRAEQYMDPALLGTITEGKVEIGEAITFATIQTMCKLDLESLRDEWDCIIVDECHRVAGSPTSVTQFSKVLNGLRARHKYGLSATVHRADGLIRATHALLGEVVYTVPDEAVTDRVMQVTIKPVDTEIPITRDCLNTDGTLNYAKTVTYLTQQIARNRVIEKDLIENKGHYNLILSERVEHLKRLYSMLPAELQEQASVIDGKMTSKVQKAEREQAIEDMRTGAKRYLFATYALAKEGLDVPRMDRLFLVTPQKDYAVITQSIGRIARKFDGKEDPVVYDYVDASRFHLKAYKTRCTTYRKCGCKFKED